ncbi:FTR1 family protein [Gammaproteobacteria bacterium]|nr:FTR1 family protein [Gammaproteobacteria bacterium]
MLLTSVVLVLREVLEASLLISILSAFSGVLGIKRSWIGWSLLFGLAGALVYSFAVSTISDWFDGVGQEVISATMQFLIFLLLLLFAFLAVRDRNGQQGSGRMIVPVMIMMVSVAVAREGFEILVYLHGFSADLPRFMTIVSGAVIGACIGISVGILIYYFVSALQGRLLWIAGLGLLSLVAAGMLSQAVLLLIQADWLPSQLPVWDSSGWLPENSVTGQLLYALIGYEATPTALQAALYFGGLFLFLIIAVLSVRPGKQYP